MGQVPVKVRAVVKAAMIAEKKATFCIVRISILLKNNTYKFQIILDIWSIMIIDVLKFKSFFEDISNE